ncbi:MAG: ABC transporter substrate-binding protein, partial [Firmicutes bacterium]|nr:ABC transporter substrate-binding protein [Bacillota bacterium]
VIAMLIDREKIVTNLLLGYGDPLYGPILPLHFAYDANHKEQTVDLAAARQLLVEAGHEKVELTLIYNVGNIVRENVAFLLKEEAAKVGIKVEISLLEWEAFLTAVNEGDYDLAIFGRGVEADPDMTFHWHSESPGNSLGYKNKEVDALIEEAVATSEQSERTQLYREAEKLIAADTPAVWLYARQAVHATTARLEHFVPHPESLFYNVHQWTLTTEEETP